MNLIYGYLLVAVLSGAAAYLTGRAGGGAFWLYTAGCVLFLLAAAGQYFKNKQGK